MLLWGWVGVVGGCLLVGSFEYLQFSLITNDGGFEVRKVSRGFYIRQCVLTHTGIMLES